MMSVEEEKSFFVMYADEGLTESLWAYESIQELLDDLKRRLETGYDFAAIKCFRGRAVKVFRDRDWWFWHVTTEQGAFHIQTNECIGPLGTWYHPIYSCDCEYRGVT